MPALPERTIDDRFVIQQQIGTGRMSSVYVAIDTASNDRRVAVKILNTQHPDSVKRELFRRETTALRRLRHPNIVNLQHSGWSASEEAFYLILDYLPYSLDRYLADDYESPPRVHPYRIVRDLAAALAHAHSEDVVHRDIKPSNVLLTNDGRPMLTDFGISKLLTHLTVGETLASFWSAGYASPEQRTGQPASTHSDVYSLGAVFYRMLSHRQPPPRGPYPSHGRRPRLRPSADQERPKANAGPRPRYQTTPWRGSALCARGHPPPRGVAPAFPNPHPESPSRPESRRPLCRRQLSRRCGRGGRGPRRKGGR